MLNILVVDDSILMRNNIKSYIKSLGHNVIGEADNGKLAVDMCKRLKPDVITMDITMPDMDGLSSIKKIREFDAKVNIIVVTSHGQEEVIMRALSVGAKGYILKPISENNLKKSIENIYDYNDIDYRLDD